LREQADLAALDVIQQALSMEDYALLVIATRW
jgi:hypothetical protein